MGNTIGGRNKAKVMRTNGETFKFKAPIEAWDIMKGYPGHVLLESEAVKKLGLRARPLSPQEELKKNRIYFLVEMPMFPKRKSTRRARSDINTSMESRLERLTLMRGSSSDLSMRHECVPYHEPKGPGPGPSSGRMKLRLPKAELARLMEESQDEGEVARKIIELYGMKSTKVDEVAEDRMQSLLLHHQQMGSVTSYTPSE